MRGKGVGKGWDGNGMRMDGMDVLNDV